MLFRGVAMAFQIPCGCGNRVKVSGAQAGFNVDCGCGRSLPVPSLSELRAGMADEPTNNTRPARDRSAVQVIGMILFAAGLFVGLIGGVVTSGSKDPMDAVIVLWASFCVQASGLIVWAWAKNQPLWFSLLVAPFGLIGAIVLLLTPTAEPRSS